MNPRQSISLVISSCLCLIFLTPPTTVSGQNAASNVQEVLRDIADKQPEKVSYILATRSWHLNNPRTGYLKPEDEERLKAAFLEDILPLTKVFSWKYLMDWKLIAAKAARETFWGSSFLCNRAQNYFGIRAQSKPWACEVFGYCEEVTRNDPKPAGFVVFPDYEASLWMFVHTIYNAHFLERYPDDGLRVFKAINYERKYGHHYWQGGRGIDPFIGQLPGTSYSADQTMKTWSGYKANNLCVACDVASDKNWMRKVDAVLASQKK